MSNNLQKSMVLGGVENTAEMLRRKELRSLRAVGQLSGIFSVVPRYMPYDILNGEYESGEDEARDALGVKSGGEGRAEPEGEDSEAQDDKDGLNGKHHCEAEEEEEEGESDGGGLRAGNEDEDDYEDEDEENGGTDGAENDESTDDEVNEEQPVIEIPRSEFIQAWKRLNSRPTRAAWRRQFTGTCLVCSKNGLRCDFSTPSDGARPQLACTGCHEAKQACYVKANFALFDMPKNLNLTTNFVRWALNNNWQVQPRVPRKTLSVEKRPLLEPERGNSKASKSKPGPGVNSAGKVDGKVKEVRGDVSGGPVSRAGGRSKGRVAWTIQLSGSAKSRPKVKEQSKARAAGTVVDSQSKDAIDGVGFFHDAPPSQQPLPSDSPQPPSPVPGPVPPTEHTSTLSMERDEITTRNNLDVMLANAANSQRQKTISILVKQVDRLREERNTLRRSNETISLELTGVRGQDSEKDRVALPVVASSDERSADDVTQLKGELAISQDRVKDLENQLAASVASVDVLKEDLRKWRLRAEEGTTEMATWKGRAMTTMEEVLGLELDRARLRLAVQNPADKIYGLLERPSDRTLPAISGAISDIRCALSRDAVTDTRQLLEGRNPSWLYDPYSQRSVVRRGDRGYSDVEIEGFLDEQHVYGARTESTMSPHASMKRAAVSNEDDDNIPGPSKRVRSN
ncbi:hypothetical protein FPV67DRAFT_1552453 [Lyophyllum atratum]|nr:hypothetical protein FPV67DRAFT_1552453 [Lyophyllum atratum]